MNPEIALNNNLKDSFMGHYIGLGVAIFLPFLPYILSACTVSPARISTLIPSDPSLYLLAEWAYFITPIRLINFWYLYSALPSTNSIEGGAFNKLWGAPMPLLAKIAYCVIFITSIQQAILLKNRFEMAKISNTITSTYNVCELLLANKLQDILLPTKIFNSPNIHQLVRVKFLKCVCIHLQLNIHTYFTFCNTYILGIFEIPFKISTYLLKIHNTLFPLLTGTLINLLLFKVPQLTVENLFSIKISLRENPPFFAEWFGGLRGVFTALCITTIFKICDRALIECLFFTIPYFLIFLPQISYTQFTTNQEAHPKKIVIEAYIGTVSSVQTQSSI
jgi:hypothetical protein